MSKDIILKLFSSKSFSLSVVLYLIVFLVYWGGFNYYLENGIVTDWKPHRIFAMNPDYKIPPNALFHRLVQLVGDRTVGVAFIAASAKCIVLIVIAELYLRRSAGAAISKIGLAAMVAVAMPILFLSANKLPYLGKFGINLIHNPTYLLMAPIALLFWWTFSRRVINNGEKTLGILVALGLVGFLLAYAKPSYHLAFLPAAVLICIRPAFSSKKVFLWFLVLGIVLSLPVSIQMIELFFPELGGFSRSKIIIAPFTVLNMIVKDPLGALLSSYAFPILVGLTLLISLKKKELIPPAIKQCRRNFMLSLLVLAMAFVIAIVFAEDGIRMKNANFVWNIYSAGLIVFAESVTLVYAHIENRKRVVFALASIFILAMHAYYGVIYAIQVFSGLRGF